MRIKKQSEHDHQVNYFKWVDIKLKSDERYLNIYAVPNGGLRNIRVAVKLKKEGVRSGVLDINIDWPSGGFNGLRIEMKVGRNKPTDNQKEWIKRYNRAGFKTEVCYSFDEAIKVTENYFKLG